MPRVVDHEKRREELLEACFGLFARQGYAGLTMRRIARELGVSTGTLYHYFDGKADLFAQMFRWIRARDIRALAESVPQGLDLPTRLAALDDFIALHSTNMANALRIALEFHREAPDEAGRALLHETLAEYRAAVQSQLELADPAQAATVLSCLLGILTHHILDPDQVSVRDQVRAVRSALVVG